MSVSALSFSPKFLLEFPLIFIIIVVVVAVVVCLFVLPRSDFGLATLKIWQNAMNMRGESKGVVDALTQVIMTGWDLSPSVRPILTINYVVRY